MTIHSVAQYTEGLNAQGKHYVNEFATFMHERFPELNQKISFAMPMWLVNTKMKEGYVAVSAAKNHFSIHFSDEAIVARLRTHCRDAREENGASTSDTGMMHRL